jgi:hypothetical protein
MAIGLRKISRIIPFPDFFFSLLTDIHLIFGTLSCRSSSSLVFYPFQIHEVMAHGLRKTLQIVSSLHFGRLALQSQVVRNQNLVLFFLNYFD